MTLWEHIRDIISITVIVGVFALMIYAGTQNNHDDNTPEQQYECRYTGDPRC